MLGQRGREVRLVSALIGQVDRALAVLLLLLFVLGLRRRAAAGTSAGASAGASASAVTSDFFAATLALPEASLVRPA